MCTAAKVCLCNVDVVPASLVTASLVSLPCSLLAVLQGLVAICLRGGCDNLAAMHVEHLAFMQLRKPMSCCNGRIVPAPCLLLPASATCHCQLCDCSAQLQPLRRSTADIISRARKAQAGWSPARTALTTSRPASRSSSKHATPAPTPGRRPAIAASPPHLQASAPPRQPLPSGRSEAFHTKLRHLQQRINTHRGPARLPSLPPNYYVPDTEASALAAAPAFPTHASASVQPLASTSGLYDPLGGIAAVRGPGSLHEARTRQFLSDDDAAWLSTDASQVPHWTFIPPSVHHPLRSCLLGLSAI